MKIRVGWGYDVHRFAVGRELWLGGVKIEHERGLDGHSDADALLHALCDALLGAMGKRDLGFFFPNNDPQWKGADSKTLLARVMEIVRGEGYEVQNADLTVVAEAPKIGPYVPEIRRVVADLLQIPQENVALKATTNEGMGFIGRGEGVAAMAAVLLAAP
ncbi:MAG: 2-C-methyl-D-erythritol 2,4-cyclodiphosphate synthase [Bacteroidia bacterium]|nr:2-C-methyl-D-erythritol 2,4-cyclodiphosphate synthase [Bacteroidia bacterium]